MAEKAPLQTIARLTGLAYLAIFALAIGANFAVIMPITGAGTPQQVLAELQAQEGAFRMAVAALFLVLMADLTVSWGLYAIFAGRARELTLFTVLFRLAYTIGHIPVLLNLVAALRLSSPDAMAVLDEAGRAAWIQEHLLAHAHGFMLTLLFFGVHLVALGVLIWQTRAVPRAIAVLLVWAGAGYLADGFLWLVAPDLRSAIPGGGFFIVILPALVGEGALTVWLLVKGVKPDFRT